MTEPSSPPRSSSSMAIFISPPPTSNETSEVSALNTKTNAIASQTLESQSKCEKNIIRRPSALLLPERSRSCIPITTKIGGLESPSKDSPSPYCDPTPPVVDSDAQPDDPAVAFFQGSEYTDFSEFPSKNQFIRAMNSLFKDRDGNIPVSFSCPTKNSQYVFKITEDEYNQFSLSGISIIDKTCNPFPDCQLQWHTFGNVIAFLAPIFENPSLSDEQLRHKIEELFSLPKDHFEHNRLKQICEFSDATTIGGFDDFFPTSQDIEETLNILWGKRSENGACMHFTVGMDKYYIKLSQNKNDYLECEILHASDNVKTIDEAEYLEFDDLPDAISFFKPFFDQLYVSEEEFLGKLMRALIERIITEFIDDAACVELPSIPSTTKFRKSFNSLGQKDKPSLCFHIQNKQINYYLNFENATNRVIFDGLRISDEGIDCLPKHTRVQFASDKDALTCFSEIFNRHYTSDEQFYKALCEMCVSREISSILSADHTLQDQLSNFKDTSPQSTESAFSTLQGLDTHTVLKIASKDHFTTAGALVLFYLNFIQLKQDPDSVKDVPHYPGKAFLNRDGCVSTPEQRASANAFTRLHLLMYALEKALTIKDKKQIRAITGDINTLGKDFLDQDLAQKLQEFQIDWNQSYEENLKNVAKIQQAMNDALNLV